MRSSVVIAGVVGFGVRLSGKADCADATIGVASATANRLRKKRVVPFIIWCGFWIGVAEGYSVAPPDVVQGL
jgi:hypothetical protein